MEYCQDILRYSCVTGHLECHQTYFWAPWCQTSTEHLDRRSKSSPASWIQNHIQFCGTELKRSKPLTVVSGLLFYTGLFCQRAERCWTPRLSFRRGGGGYQGAMILPLQWRNVYRVSEGSRWSLRPWPDRSGPRAVSLTCRLLQLYPYHKQSYIC